MSPVRKFKPPNRLKTLVFASGGMTVAAALQRAGENLVGLRASCEADIARRVAQIDRDFGPASPDRQFRELADLYELSAGIIDASAAPTAHWTHRAAHALCDVIDHCETVGTTDWEVISVHIGAIVLLHQAGAGIPGAAAETVLAGLDEVFRKRFESEGQVAAPDDP